MQFFFHRKIIKIVLDKTAKPQMTVDFGCFVFWYVIMSIIMYIQCVFAYVYEILYLWNVVIDDEHQILEYHCFTCHSHISSIEQDTG